MQIDPSFAANVKNLVILGGTYLNQGNTNYFCTEFNLYKDPEAAKIVFDNFRDITMVPIETCQVFRAVPKELVEKPFTHIQTVRGKLIFDAFRVAL